MPVKPVIRVIESGGWKKEENSRFGSVVVGVFETYDSEGKVKTFQFAPTLADLPVLQELISITKEVDELNKSMLRIKERAEKIEPRRGACFNE